MSYAGSYLKRGISLFNALDEGKPHSSITDWVEVLSSDRYDELSLDGIHELVESVNIQGHFGTKEAARAVRKKLKYGNVHRQLRALVILRCLTENAGKGFQLHWANQELLNRLKEMANDSLLDPKVKRKLVLVFHAWSIQYKDEPRMHTVAGLYRQYGGGPGVRRLSTVSASTTSATPRSSTDASRNPASFSDYDSIFGHDWNPTTRGRDTYADLSAAKADADERKRHRENRIAIEQREAEIERKERELKRRQDMAAIEARRQKEAAEEAERRRQAKEAAKHKPEQAKRPKFDFQKERPQVMVAVANALQAANNLVNSCRHINRELESLTESPKVQENLDKAKAARRAVIRYVQLVTDEEYVGTLIDANEKVVEAIQLYDRLSKPAVLDSDSEDESAPPDSAKIPDVHALSRRMAAQRLEADRTGELDKLQERQKRESARQQQRRAQRQVSVHPDLQDLNFGSISSGKDASKLPAPMHPDSDRDSYGGGSLSDFSDYDSSNDEWRASRSRRQSHAAAAGGPSKRDSTHAYRSLEAAGAQGRNGLLDPNDPFSDPFADDSETPADERQRMQWAEI